MSHKPLRIATTGQLLGSVRSAGFEGFLLPEEVNVDFNRTLQQRMADGEPYRRFLEENRIDLVIDFNTGAMTFVPTPDHPGEVSLTTAALGIPYVACYLDPVTSTMAQVPWNDHWHILRNNAWIKAISDVAHMEELSRLGVTNLLYLPMAVAGEESEFDTTPCPQADPGPVVAFMGHPASSWFKSQQPTLPEHLLPGLVAAAVHADMPEVAFHSIYYDLYNFAEPPSPTDDPGTIAAKARQYYNDKFLYNAYLAVRQRDRWARFLKTKLGDQFELIGDFWDTNYGLTHSPRIWDRKELYRRMRHVPICLNLIKGNIESSVIIRHFEITACGGFMLTYPTPELSKFFEIGKECEVFTDESDLLEKIQYYLAHPKERYEIAAAGQRRTLSEHLYSHRITKLVTALRDSGALPREAGNTETPDRSKEEQLTETT